MRVEELGDGITEPDVIINNKTWQYPDIQYTLIQNNNNNNTKNYMVDIFQQKLLRIFPKEAWGNKTTELTVIFLLIFRG